MEIKINVKKRHMVLFVTSLALLTLFGFAYAQATVKTQGWHGARQLEIVEDWSLADALGSLGANQEICTEANINDPDSGCYRQPISNNPASPWVESGSTISYNAGNVGIGTTNPSRLLHLETTTGNTDLRLQAGAGGNTIISLENAGQTATIGQTAGGAVFIRTDSTGGTGGQQDRLIAYSDGRVVVPGSLEVNGQQITGASQFNCRDVEAGGALITGGFVEALPLCGIGEIATGGGGFCGAEPLTVSEPYYAPNRQGWKALCAGESSGQKGWVKCCSFS